MPEFPWVPVPYEKIGLVYLPLCEVEIKSKNGRWIRVGFEVDSGAGMTLMEMDDPTNVNKKKFLTHVRNFDIKIGKDMIKDVPIAFSVKPIEIPLLGRMKIFDYFRVCFDDVKKQTTFRVIRRPRTASHPTLW